MLSGLQAIPIALLAGLLIFHFMKQLWSSRSYPPGPLRLPVIGGTWRLVINRSHNMFMEMAKQYGNVFTVWLGRTPLIVLSGFEAVKEVLINHSEYFVDRPVGDFLKALTQERGIALSTGHTWKQQRKFGIATMRKLGLGKKGMEQAIQEEARELIETFARAKGHPLDPSLPITNSVSNVICAAAFKHRFSVEDEEFIMMMEAMGCSTKFGGSFFHGLYILFPRLAERIPGPHKKVLAYADAIRSFIKKQIARHKEQQSMHDPQDFIDFYLLHIEKCLDEPNSTYNEENLVQCVFDLFTGGTETSATTLQWALLLMAKHPDIQEKVQKEMEDILGSSQSISYQDRKKLPYTNAVIHEIMRAHYVLMVGFPRRCVKDMNLFGFFIPKGAHILPDLRSVLRDPKQWENPEDFNPDHFLDQDGNFVEREAFLPFGAGARVCVGEQMARTELFIFFTSLLRAFTFQLPEGVKELNMKPIMGSSMHPHPYKLCVLPRCHAS